MKDDDNGDKYLDPEENPMIYRDPDRQAKQEPDFALTRDGLIPLAPPPETIKAMIETAFPEVNDFEIGGHKIVKMADGSFTLDDSPLKEASPEVRLEIWDAILQAKK